MSLKHSIPAEQLARMTPLARIVLENEFERISSMVDYTGKKIGRLRVLRRVDLRNWLVVCSCGRMKNMRTEHLRSGARSCGCLRVECGRKKARRNQMLMRERRAMRAAA